MSQYDEPCTMKTSKTGPVDHFAQIESVKAKMLLAERDRRENTSASKRLMDAIATSQSERAMEALEDGADIESRYASDSALPRLTVGMLCAMKYMSGNYNGTSHEAYKLILQRCDTDAVDANGLTALMHAAAECNLDALKILAPRSNIDAKATQGDPDMFDGWPALFFALNRNWPMMGGDKRSEAERLAFDLIDILGTPGALAATDESGLDAWRVAERFGPCEAVVDALNHRKGLLAARLEAAKLEEVAQGTSKKRAGLTTL